MKRRSFLTRIAVYLSALPIIGKLFTECAEAITYSAAESTGYVDLSGVQSGLRNKIMQDCCDAINMALQQLPEGKHIKVGYRNILERDQNPRGENIFFRVFSSGKAGFPVRDPLRDNPFIRDWITFKE